MALGRVRALEVLSRSETLNPIITGYTKSLDALSMKEVILYKRRFIMNGTSNSIMLAALEASNRMGLKPTIHEILDITQWIESCERFSQAELLKLKSTTYELAKRALDDVNKYGRNC